jgi:tyrosinase
MAEPPQTPIAPTSHSNHVVINIPSEVHRRVEILDFGYKPEYEKQRTLLLLGFRQLLYRDPTDPRSYWQIAGIHGIPYAPYDGVKGDYSKRQTGWGGYCQHGNPLFPTFHRPYVMLLEQRVKEEAKKVIDSWSWLNEGAGLEEKKVWMEELNKLRLPYWDWANHSTEIFGVPDIFTQPTLQIKIPIGFSVPTHHEFIVNIHSLPPPKYKIEEIANPLRAFTVNMEVGSPEGSSDSFNPTQRPYRFPLNNSTPWTPKGFATVRHPDENYKSKDNVMNLAVQRFSSIVFRPGIYLALQEQDYTLWSNHYSSIDPKKKNDYGHYSSLEVVHDAVHDALGGNGGHMSYPDIAAFDPIFFFHHCNVDRLLALWQRYNDSWIKPSDDFDGTFNIDPGATIDSKTPLYPFRKTPDAFFNSDDVRDVTKLGYTYPELVTYKDKTPEQFKKIILNMYKPLDWTQNIYTAVFPNIPKRKLGGPFSIRVFIDLPTANANTPLTDIHFAGSVYVFARGADVVCANCETHLKLRGTVDLTNCLKNLGRNVDAEPGSTTQPGSPPDLSGIKNSVTLVLVNKSHQEVDPVMAGWAKPGQQLSELFNVEWSLIVDGQARFSASTADQ